MPRRCAMRGGVPCSSSVWRCRSCSHGMRRTHRRGASSTTAGRLTMSIHRAGDSDHRAPLLRRLIAAAPSWYAVVVVVLASGIVVRLAWLAAGLVRLRRLRRIGLPAPDAFSDLVAAGADVRYVDHVGQPVTFGIRHPVVLLPSTLRALPEPVQHAVLAHELWHVRRRDWAWVVVEEALRATLWFHPAIWWLISRDPVVARGSGGRADAARDRVAAPLP